MLRRTKDTVQMNLPTKTRHRVSRRVVETRSGSCCSCPLFESLLAATCKPTNTYAQITHTHANKTRSKSKSQTPAASRSSTPSERR
jgi:hypothetical protein